MRSSTHEFCEGDSILPTTEALTQGSDTAPVMLYMFIVVAICMEQRGKKRLGTMVEPSTEIQQRGLLGRAQLSFMRTVAMVSRPRRGNLEKGHFLLYDKRGEEEERGQLR